MIRRLLCALFLLSTASLTLGAQDTRASLLRQATTAYDDFAPARALDLARAALDPALGPPDSAWVRSVHLLAQVLIEGGDEPLARTWARWALRTDRTMRIDSVNFLAGVVATLRQARDSVGARTSGDDVARMSWQWATRGSTETQGRLRLDPSTMPVPVSVLVRGVGVLPAGAGLSLAPGTYEVEVSAPGYLPGRVMREILPGATLTLSFQLTSAAVVAGTIGETVRQSVYRSTAALSITRFGAPASCAAGAFVGSGRLVLSSYAAIRGAEGISATLSTGVSAGDGIRVAAYDATSNLAVLAFPNARPDSLALSSSIVDGQAVWGVGLAQCRTMSDTRAIVNEWTQRPLGALLMSETIAQAVPGSPVVDYQGSLAGIWTAGTGAIPAPNAAALLELARQNLAAQRTLTLAEIARRENHIFGTLAIAADVTGASVRVTPLENWHWAELGTTVTSPVSFSGPVGRYRLEFSAPGVPSRTQEAVIRAGETVRVQVPLRTVAGGGPGAPNSGTVKKGGIPKWVWFAVIGGGAAAAAALGGGGGGGGGGGTTGPTTGTITISVPNP